MKKILKWGLIAFVGLIVLGVIISALGDSQPSSNSERASNTPNNENAAAQSNTEVQVEKMTISNTAVNDKGYGLFEIIGEITNNDSKEHSATIKATFYGSGGKILGTAVGAINDVSSGQTKTFNLVSTDDVSGYAEYKVEVDALI